MPTKFSQFIAAHSGGLVDDEATEELRNVLEACAQEKKNGKVTVTVEVRPEGDAFVISVDVASKAPKAAAAGRLYWTDLDGYPSQRNPIQPSLDDEMNERGIR